MLVCESRDVCDAEMEPPTKDEQALGSHSWPGPILSAGRMLFPDTSSSLLS